MNWYSTHDSINVLISNIYEYPRFTFYISELYLENNRTVKTINPWAMGQVSLYPFTLLL